MLLEYDVQGFQSMLLESEVQGLVCMLNVSLSTIEFPIGVKQKRFYRALFDYTVILNTRYSTGNRF